MSAENIPLLVVLVFGVFVGTSLQRFRRARQDFRRTAGALGSMRKNMQSAGTETFFLIAIIVIAAYAAFH
jgi:hypothetical protein